MIKKNSLHFKLNMFILSMLFLIVSIGFIIAINIFINIYEADVLKNISSGVPEFRAVVIDKNKDQLLSFAEGLIDPSYQLLTQKNSNNEENIKEYIRHANNNGVVFVQIRSLDQVSYEARFCDPLVLELASHNSGIRGTKATTWIDGNAKIGLFLFAVEPILDASSNQIGDILVGLPIANQDDVEYIKHTSSLDATIFSGNKRVATTIIKNNMIQIGTVLDNTIAATVLGDGQDYYGQTNILGEPYMVAYVPLLNPQNQPVGALFLGKSMLSMITLRNQLAISLTFLGLLILLVFFTISNHWLKKNVTFPITGVANAMKKISERDYAVIQNLPVAKNEEIEILQSSMAAMVTELAAGQKKLETAAFIDPTTGLPNRIYLYEKYGGLSLFNKQTNVSVIYYLDVDNLKYINNLFGHRTGDGLLIQIGQSLKTLIQDWPEYEVYRISGDEFAICKEGFFNRDAVTHLSKSILTTFEKAFTINEQSVSTSVSIGISYNDCCNGTKCPVCTGKCKDNLEMLLKKAELAMNQVKLNGKNNFMLFDPSMNDAIQRTASLQQDLKLALKNEALEVYYQPKFDLGKNRYDGMEALIRWNHPDRGFIPPPEFIKVAEESNLIIELGAWILEKSCRFIKEYNCQHQTNYSIAVNVSTVQLLNEHFETSVLAILESTGLNPAFLELEITESVFMHSIDTANAKLDFLREKNISIALDDFGTGYSSLTYLKSLPISTLKLDKSFIDDIASNAISFEIVDSVIQIARSIGLNIVVEGIETEDQLQILKRLKCHKIQGYYFSRPVPEAELSRVLSEYQ